MIMNMRKRATVIMIIVIVAFVGMMILGWGANITGGRGLRARKGAARDTVLAEVGKQIVGVRYFDAQLSSIAEEVGVKRWDWLSPSQRERIIEQAWDKTIQEAIWVETLRREKPAPVSEQELQYWVFMAPPPEFTEDTTFFVNGKFSYEKYQNLLNGTIEITEKQKRIIQKHMLKLYYDIPREKLTIDINNSVRLTRSQQVNAQLRGGTRMIVDALRIYELPEFDSTVTEEQIKAYYKEHLDDFERKQWWQLRTIWFTIKPSAEDSNQLKEAMDEAFKAVDNGYDFEKIAKDFGQDSSFVVTREIGALTQLEFDAFSNVAEGEYAPPYFFRGMWHIAKLEKRTPKEITYRLVVRPLEPGAKAREELLAQIEEFRKRAKKESIDSLIIQYKLTSRVGPYVRKESKVLIPNYPYSEGVKTYAFNSKVGDISKPFPEFRGTYYIFYTEDIAKQTTTPLDSNRNYIISRILTERGKKVQREYAFEIRRKLENGASFEDLADMPHVSLVRLEFASFFEAKTRYGANTAGACYALQPGEAAGPVKWGDSEYYGFFKCIERSFDPGSEFASQEIQNEYTDMLNELSEEVFVRDNVKDHRRAKNFRYGG